MSRIRITVMEAFPDAVRLVELQLGENATVADALSAPAVVAAFPDAASRPFGIYARRVDASTKLRDGDRIELYRPLIADAKKNRMERVARQREARSADRKR